MADIMLHTSSMNQVTCVDNIFIDEYMKDANGEYVKIYLYLLRCLGREDLGFSISDIADNLDHTEKDVVRALEYWQKKGLLHLEYSGIHKELSGICLLSCGKSLGEAVPVSAPAKPHMADIVPMVINTPSEPKVPEATPYSTDELYALSSDEAVAELLYVAERYFRRPLSQTDINTILFWIDKLALPTDLIDYLIESSVDKGHSSIHYMNSIALSWHEKGITTIEAAKSESKAHSDVVYTIMKAFGISGRDLIPSEQSMIDQWTNVFGFSLDIICEAGRRTVMATGKGSFNYAHSILSSWADAAVKTLEDITKLDEAHNASYKPASKPVNKPNSFTSFNQRNNDYDAIEEAWLNKNKK